MSRAVPDSGGEPGGERISTYSRSGLVFDVLDDGPLEGPAVVLLHGFPERASHWDGVARLLHREGLRTLAPDQRGYSPGASPDAVEDYAGEHLVSDVLGVLEQPLVQHADVEVRGGGHARAPGGGSSGG